MRNVFFKISTLLFFIFVFFGCKKEQVDLQINQPDQLLEQVKVYLKNNLSSEDFSLMDWGKSRLPRQSAKTNVFFLKQKNAPNENFVLVVHHEGKWMANFLSLNERPGADSISTTGTIIVEALNRESKKTYHFNNGKVVDENALSINQISSSNIRHRISEDGGSGTLPEVTVRGIRFRTQIYWHSLYWLLGQQPSMLYLYTNDPMRYNPEVEGGSGGDTEAVEPEEDDSAAKDSVNIQKMIDCFGNVPDANANYEVKIHSDIPINSNPEASVNIGFNNKGNPGHVFLRLTKTSGSQQVSQVIGFYPQNGLRSIVNPGGDVDSKIVNDGLAGSQHEYNASFSTFVSAAGFQRVIDKILNNANRPYNLLFFNCAHFALEAFNEIYPLASEPYTPLGYRFGMFTFDESPQGLYKTLGAMKDQQVPGTEHNVNKKSMTSKGECD